MRKPIKALMAIRLVMLLLFSCSLITACGAGGKSNDSNDDPHAVPVAGVSLNPSSATIAVTGVQQITATVSPSDATNRNVTWSSGNSSIATVNDSGLVTGVAAGTTTITATTQDGGYTASADVTVQNSSRWQPDVADTWQWQLSGTVNTTYDVDVYDIDLFDSSAELIDGLHGSGHKVVCYFEAGGYEDWRPDKDDFNEEDLGNTMDGWPDERWLDIRSANVLGIMQARLDLAEQKGCDGVEPDNIAGYSNDTGFPLTAEDQLEFNRFLAREAHSRNLAIALKNDIEQAADLEDDFDFSLNEQCHEYDECDGLAVFINAGKPVFNAEYAYDHTDSDAMQTLCTDALNRNFRTLVLPLGLDDGFRYSCDDWVQAGGAVTHGDQLTINHVGPWTLQGSLQGAEQLDTPALPPAGYFRLLDWKTEGLLPNQPFVGSDSDSAHLNDPANKGGIVAVDTMIDGFLIPAGAHVVQFRNLGPIYCQALSSGDYLFRGCRFHNTGDTFNTAYSGSGFHLYIGYHPDSCVDVRLASNSLKILSFYMVYQIVYITMF